MMLFKDFCTTHNIKSDESLSNFDIVRIIKYLKPTKNSSPIVCSTFIIQKFGTIICGQLCCYVLYMLDKEHKFLDILLSLMDEIHGIKAGGDLNEDVNLVHDVSLIAELL